MSTPLELLQAGHVEAFNARRGQRTSIDLFAADLSGLDLTGVDLSKANLEKADLSNTTLRGAKLANADLSGADLTGANLDEVIAVKARFREAYLGGAHAEDAQFAGADLTEADLTGFVAPRINLAGAKLRGATLTGADLREADLTEARMASANLREAVLNDAVLVRAEAARIDATGSTWINVRGEGALLPSAALCNCDLTGADLTGADLTGADLTGARLDGATLARADLFETVLGAETTSTSSTPSGMGAPVTVASAIHVEDAEVAFAGEAFAAIWENAEDDESYRVRVAWGTVERVTHTALDVPNEQVLAKTVLPAGDGAFLAVVVAERTGGVDLLVLPVDATSGCGTPTVARLGYQPAVTPVLVPDGDGFLVHGLGRTGTLEVHRWSAGSLTELMRAPAQTYRGYCGKNDAVLFTKGGTVVPARGASLGRPQVAPSGYPGDRHAAALSAEGVALVWAVKGERGFRFAPPRGDVERIDGKHAIGALDLLAVDDGYLAVWTRQGRTPSAPSTPWAAWLPDGEPFPLLDPDEDPDVDDVRIARSPDGAFVAMIDATESLSVYRVSRDEDVEIVGLLEGELG